jgi:hypothetical protein
MQWVLGSYDRIGAYDLGIYSCRAIRGCAFLSVHGEGRALDIGLPMGRDGRGTSDGHRMVQRLGRVGERLGVQCIVYDRRIWSEQSPDPEGRPWSGVVPHYNHVHLELCRQAARTLTLSRIAAVLGGRPPAEPPPLIFGRYNTDAHLGERRLRLGSAGNDVRFVQSLIGADRCGANDGLFGHQTKSGVRWYQDLRGLVPNGVVGLGTWKQLLGSAQPVERLSPVH